MNIMKLFVYFFVCVLVEASPRFNTDYDIWSDSNETETAITNKSLLDNQIDPSRLPRVLNFFPVPFEEECTSTDNRRNGVCMNAYECRIQGGSSHGPCALGFGICCIFTASCEREIFNNLTYFTNPHFPDITPGMHACNVSVRKIDPEIAQLRLDFVHFNLGQPNRRTGVCEEDVFVMFGGASKELKLCGLNSGQHAYFDVENIDISTPIEISMNFSNKLRSRLWEIRIIQVPFSQRAPTGCFQYHTTTNGIIQTMNFAENGRHLAEQDYNVCMRQEEGMCTIAYEPCDENSFKIGPGNPSASADGIGGGATPDENGVMDGGGGGGGAPIAPINGTDSTSIDDDIGSGDGIGRSMTICTDRITMPCTSDDLIMPNDIGPGFCELSHCGSSLCPGGETPCRIESAATPFIIGVQFGAAARDESPDDNLGMCLKYEQLPCAV